MNERREVPEVLLACEIRGLPQRIKQHIHFRLFQEFKSKCNLEDPLTAEIIRSVTSKESGLFLNADPREKKFQIKDAFFIIHTKRRLQMNVVKESDLRCKSCDKFVDVMTEHTFCCAKLGKNSVHAPIVKSVVRAFKEVIGASGLVKYEERLDPKPACVKENPRADVVLVNIVTGQKQIVDFIFPTIKEAATDVFSTVMFAEKDKVEFYEKNYYIEGEVIPGAIDSYGRWGDKLKELVSNVAKSGSSCEKEYSQVVNRLRTEIAVSHVRAIGKQINSFLAYHLY